MSSTLPPVWQRVSLSTPGATASYWSTSVTPMLPGIYRLTRTTPDGRQETMARDYNVDPAEGDLAKINRTQLAERWPAKSGKFLCQHDADREGDRPPRAPLG